MGYWIYKVLRPKYLHFFNLISFLSFSNQYTLIYTSYKFHFDTESKQFHTPTVVQRRGGEGVYGPLSNWVLAVIRHIKIVLCLIGSSQFALQNQLLF